MGQQSMIIVLLGSLMLSFSVFGFMGMWNTSADTVVDQFEREQAYNAATSAVNLSFSKLRLNKNWRTGYSNLPVANGTASLRVTDIGLDTVQIDAIGTYNGVTHRVSCVAKLKSIFPTVRSALTVFGDSVDFDNDGKSFAIDGRDYKEDFTLGTKPPVLGIGVQKSDIATDIKKTLIDGSVTGNVLGAGGSPSVGEFGALDLKSLRDFYANLRTITIPPGKYADNRVLGTTANPEIVHVPGDLQWNGVISGAGILVVDGKLQLSGKITWYGIVLVLAGDVIIELGGSGTPRILGTTFIGNNVATTGTGGEDVTGVHVNGNPQIMYSYDVLQKVLANLNLLRVEVIRYWE